MRKLLLVLSVFFAVLGIVFTILPLGTIAFLPIGLTLVLAFFAFRKSKGNQQKFPKWILMVAVLNVLVVVGKEVFIKDEVVVDQQFDQQKVESKEEAQKELEGLE